MPAAAAAASGLGIVSFCLSCFKRSGSQITRKQRGKERQKNSARKKAKRKRMIATTEEEEEEGLKKKRKKKRRNELQPAAVL